MRVLVGVALVGVLAAAGCRFTADYSGTSYQCGPAGECPSGFTCMDGHCVTGAGDAAAQTDGHAADAPDAAAGDAPGGDGGTDGGDASSPDDAADGPRAQDAQRDAQQDAQQDAGVVCGKVTALADDFDDNTRSYLWQNYWEDTGTTVAENGGELVIIPATNGGNAYAGYQSLGYYDLTESSLTVEVTQMVNTATSAQAWMELAYDSNHLVSMGVESGSLSARQQDTILDEVTYDPQDHRWWRIRERAGTLYWETSANGSSWSQLHSMSSPAWIGYVMVALGAGTYQDVASPGEAHYDNVNVGTPTVPYCPISSIQDDFADGDPGIIWENRYADNGSSYAEGGGLATFTPSSTGPSETAYASSYLYDLRGGTLSIEVTGVTNNGPGLLTWMGVQAGWDDGLHMVYQSGRLLFRTQVGGSLSTVDNINYNPSTHRWWRIAESGGTSSWWTSPDGVTWTQRASIANPCPLDAVMVVFGAFCSSTVANPGTATFDNVNLSQ